MKKLIIGLIFIMALVLDAETRGLYLSLSKELRGEIDREMKSLVTQFDNSINTLADDVSSYVEARPNLTKKQISKQLGTLQKDGGGMFGTAAKTITGAATDKTFLISEDIFLGGLKTEADFRKTKDLMMWTAVFVNTCPDCLKLHGQVKTRANWDATGGGPNERDTVCTIHGQCHCNLIPADTMPSKDDMLDPIKIQSKRIRKAEKKRGKNYAPSTKASFLGQINNPKSTVADLRKVKKVKT